MLADEMISMPEIKLEKPEISMAPLVDIVFLLLIFFMVTTVFPDDGLIIEKPSSKSTTPLNNESLKIKLDQQGNAYIEEQLVTIEDIKRVVNIELTISPQQAVIVYADRRATTESLIKIIDAAKAGGAKKLGIAADEK